MANLQAIKDMAARHASKIVLEGRDAGLTAYEICEVCEIATSIVLYVEAEREEVVDKLFWANNLLLDMSKKMKRRVECLVSGEKFRG